MEEALVKNLLQNLSKQSEEIKSLHHLNKELQPLSSQLGRMNSFPKKIEQTENEQKMVDQIRDFAHYVEDVIDNYMVSSIRNERVGHNNWQKYFRLGNLKAKCDMGRKIKEIKKKFNAIYTGKDNLEKERNHGDEAGGSSHAKACISEEADVVGFTSEILTLVERLTSEKSKLARTVISIVGMAGLGKSTLATKIYNHNSVKERFELRAWVCASLADSQAGLIFRILEFFNKVTEENKAMHEDDMGKELWDYLKGKTYLIVLDDVWKTEVWDGLKAFLPDDNNGSRVLLTTRFRKLALNANKDPKDPPHYLRFLEKADSWDLFKSKAFQGKTCSPKWEELGRQIAGKCGGLPLAIEVLGRLLWDERKAYYEELKKEAKERWVYYRWSKICSRVSTHLYKHSDACKQALALSYNYLPHHMKPCFLYLSTFPQDHQIPARQLIQLWVAEGFITEYADSSETMEDTAGRYLEMFADRGLIQVVQRRLENGKVKTCRIHSLYRDFCISEAEKEKFLHVNNGSVFPRRLVGDTDTIQRISSGNAKNLRQLRSLLCFTHMSGTSEAWNHLFKTTKFLKVFSVPHVSILPDTVGNLPLLRYLGLDNNSLQQIPSSVCNLPNLQVLDARSKFLPTVPDGIWGLKKVRHVYFKGPAFLPLPSVTPQQQVQSPTPPTPKSKSLKTPPSSTLSQSHPVKRSVLPSLQSQSPQAPRPRSWLPPLSSSNSQPPPPPLSSSQSQPQVQMQQPPPPRSTSSSFLFPSLTQTTTTNITTIPLFLHLNTTTITVSATHTAPVPSRDRAATTHVLFSATSSSFLFPSLSTTIPPAKQTTRTIGAVETVFYRPVFFLRFLFHLFLSLSCRGASPKKKKKNQKPARELSRGRRHIESAIFWREKTVFKNSLVIRTPAFILSNHSAFVQFFGMRVHAEINSTSTDAVISSTMIF